jgi:hypothetical protein
MELKAYIFDWDDNILHMNTKINMEKKIDESWTPVEIPTSDFTTIRNNKNYRIPLKDGKPDYDFAYANFRDNGPKGEDVFLEDCIEAIDNLKVGPSYLAFKKCLIEGGMMLVCTARGHNPNNIRKGVQYFIDTQFTPLEMKLMLDNMKLFYERFIGEYKKGENLIKNYLNICEFIGVSSDFFINSVEEEHIPEGHTFEPSNTELGKIIAVERFSKRCIEFGELLGDELTKIKVGFSDDDLGNVGVIKDVFKGRLKDKFPDVSFVIYDTSKNKDGTKNYKKTIH